ncbi:HAD-IA family hydrolase [Candidatus Fermentibacteria bacterium]|nr:HAD-IA family hydrolase [Candidatus Fermentibacteria bacterium]
MTIAVHPRARALLFDVDGTLADTMPLHFWAWHRLLEDMGIDYPQDMFHALAGMPTQRIVGLVNQRFEVSLDPRATAAAKERLFATRLHEVKPIEPVVALARHWRGVMPMAVGTGGRRRLVQRILHTVGLRGWFRIIVAAEDVTDHKPAPDTWLTCARRLAVPLECCQVFEDGDLGLEAARQAGMIATDIRPFLLPEDPFRVLDG